MIVIMLLIKLGDRFVEVLGQLVGIFDGHTPSLPQIGLHGMCTVAQQDDLPLGPLEHRGSVKDVTPQNISLWCSPASQS